MARRVFFSFHYERDVWRAGQVRNSWVTRERESAGFWDAADWEEIKTQGEDAVKRWIDRQLSGTSVTAVLIGAETNDRPYVDYEIIQSRRNGNGLLAIYIDSLKDQRGNVDLRGPNPFDYWHTGGESPVYFNRLYSTYDWILDRGYQNIGSWVEKAAKDAGR